MPTALSPDELLLEKTQVPCELVWHERDSIRLPGSVDCLTRGNFFRVVVS
jgi:hypothetical protein